MSKPVPSAEWKRRISIGRSLLIHRSPIIASLLFGMDIVLDTKMGTAWTNCVDTIGVPEGFAFDCPDTDYAFVLAHEVSHKMLVHDEMSKALGMTNPVLANIAQDYVINRIVIEGEGIALSDNWHRTTFDEFVGVQNGIELKHGKPYAMLLDNSLAGLSSYEIYLRLVDELGENFANPQPVPGIMGEDNKPGQDPDGGDDGGDADGQAGGGSYDSLTQKQLDKIRQDVVGAITEGLAETGKQRGSLSADMQRIFEAAHDPKVGWDEVLNEFVTSYLGFGYQVTYTRLNKRLLPHGVYSPGYKGERVGRLCIMIDTSGSIGANELGIMQEELQSLMDAKAIEALDLIYVDTKVCHSHTIDNGQPVILEPRGGGGTDFRPGFEWVEEQPFDYQAIIYFTDGYGCFPETEPATPTLWIRLPGYSLGSEKFPFGDVVDMEVL